jgi:hypothetical protein
MPSSVLLHLSSLLKKGHVCIAYGIIDNEQLLISFDPIFSSLSIEIEPIIITYYQNPIAI